MLVRLIHSEIFLLANQKKYLFKLREPRKRALNNHLQIRMIMLRNKKEPIMMILM
jgi:hypothetical protein